MTLLLRAALLTWAAGLLWAPSALAVSIGFVPSAQSVGLGQSASVDIVISGLGDGTSPSLGAFDLNVSFDPTILAPTGVTFGIFLGDPDLFEAITAFDLLLAPGVLNVAETSLLLSAELHALQPASFTLATLSFDTLARGTSALTLAINPGGLVDQDAGELRAETSRGSISVVPEPGTLLLLGLALGGVGVTAGRRGERRR
jgi:hypothetical protein